MSKWKEIKNDFTDDNGVTTIDGFRTEDDNEEGKVLAYIVNGDIYPVDHDIFGDEYAMEIIREAQGIHNERTVSTDNKNT